METCDDSGADWHDEETLVNAAIAGDTEAFDVLYRRYYRRLCAFIHMKVKGQFNDPEVEDIVQDTFCNVWKDLPKPREGLRFRPWLYRIAENRVITYQRAFSVRMKRLVPWFSLSGNERNLLSEDPAIVMLDGCLDRGLVQALDRLSPKERDCLLLQILGEFKISEIAAIYGIEEGTVSGYICRAKKKLREWLPESVKEGQSE